MKFVREMTIAEQQALIDQKAARKAYELANPWRPLSEAKPDGTVCDLLFNDMAGNFDADAYRYFLDHDGNWYRIDPPAKVYPWPSPMNWRPAFAKITPERQHYLKKQVDRA